MGFEEGGAYTAAWALTLVGSVALPPFALMGAFSTVIQLSAYGTAFPAVRLTLTLTLTLTLVLILTITLSTKLST